MLNRDKSNQQSVFLCKREKHKVLALCVVLTLCEGDRQPLTGGREGKEGSSLRTDCILTLIIIMISTERGCITPKCTSYVFDFISSSKMLGRGDDINDQITFRCLHGNVSSSPEYKSTSTLPAANPLALPSFFLPTSPLLVKLCISALGGKHYTGLAQGGSI